MVTRAITIAALLLAIGIGCKSALPEAEIRHIAGTRDLVKRDEAIETLLKKESRVYPTASKTLYDSDPEVRKVSAIVIALSARGFERDMVLRYWRRFSPDHDDTSYYIAHVLARSKSTLSQDVWHSYIREADVSANIVEAYCIENPGFVANELKSSTLSLMIKSMIQRYVRKNFDSTLADALKSSKNER